MEQNSFRWFIATVVQKILRSVGLKTIDKQFLFSYILIFIFACISAVSLYINMDASADSINLAGAQRMISQRVAKEVLLVGQGVEERSTVERSIARFEKVHAGLKHGDVELGIEAVEDPATLNQLKEVEDTWAAYKSNLINYLDSPEHTELVAIQQLAPQVLKVMNTAVGMMAAAANVDARNQQYLAMFTTLGILFLVVLGRMFGMTWLMQHIEHLKQHLQAVSQADFSRKLQVHDRDNEIGEIFTAYNEMLSQVGVLIQNVSQAAGEVSSGTSRMSTDLGQTAQGVDEQNMQLSLVASAMNEMTATVQEVSNNAQQAAEAAEKADQEASSGQKVVVSTQNNIQDMASQVANASTVLEKLRQDSIAVGNVLSVITGIAEQTNLLALNAAIEAARAGDQGRGFAVVADEVRTLAQRTQDSTKEIKATIEALQGNANEAVNAMQQSQEMAELSVSQTTEANDALGKIVDAVNIIAAMTSQIAVATEEQIKVSSEIDSNVSSIASVASQTTATTQQTVNTSNTISDEMKKLQSLVQCFKVGAN
jgi:methyl-accepting chemotaxis protein